MGRCWEIHWVPLLVRRLVAGRVAEKAEKKAWSWARDWVSRLVRQLVVGMVSWTAAKKEWWKEDCLALW